MSKLYLFLLLPFSAHASGLFHLTEFPEKRDYVETGYDLRYNELTSVKEIGNFDVDQEPINRVYGRVGRKFNDKHLFSVEFDYILTKAGKIRSGEEPVYFEYQNGMREPYFEYRQRIRKPSETQNLLDFYAGFRPSLFSRSVGKAGTNTWIGRSVLKLGLVHGAQIPNSKWEMQTLFEATRYFWGKEEDVQQNITRLYDPSYEFLTRLNVGYFFLPEWMVYGGVGINIFGDTDLRAQNNNISLQRGTSSQLNLGVKKKVSEWVIDANVTRIQHDYFVKSPSYSFDGDVEGWTMQIAFKKEI